MRRPNRRSTAGRVGRYGTNQTACLIMPPSVRQLLFRRIHDAVQVTGHHADYRLVPCFCLANSKEFKQRSNVVLVAVGVLAAKAPQRILLVGLKIGRARVQFVGVLILSSEATGLSVS